MVVCVLCLFTLPLLNIKRILYFQRAPKRLQMAIEEVHDFIDDKNPASSTIKLHDMAVLFSNAMF